MRHRKRIITMGREPEHRKATLRNLVRGLLLKGRIETTLTKARAARQKAERLITRAKEDTVHNRREVRKFLVDRKLVNKLFVEIAPRYKDRPGGYTRIVKIGPRRGDAAEMAVLSLVDYEEEK